VSRPSKVEHPQLFSFPHNLPMRNCDLAGRHFGHPHRQKGHKTDLGVIRFDEDEGSSSDRRDECLRIVGSGRVGSTWLVESHKRGFGVVRPRNVDESQDLTIDRTVPTVVGGCAKEGLVDRPTHELFGERIVVEHVDEGVRLFFQPEIISNLDIASNVIDGRLAGAIDSRVVIRELDGTNAVLEFSSEEIVP